MVSSSIPAGGHGDPTPAADFLMVATGAPSERRRRRHRLALSSTISSTHAADTLALASVEVKHPARCRSARRSP